MTYSDLLAFFRRQLAIMRDTELRFCSAEDIERLAQHLAGNLAQALVAQGAELGAYTLEATLRGSLCNVRP